MKRLLLVVAVLTVSFAGGASAADAHGGSAVLPRVPQCRTVAPEEVFDVQSHSAEVALAAVALTRMIRG